MNAGRWGLYIVRMSVRRISLAVAAAALLSAAAGAAQADDGDKNQFAVTVKTEQASAAPGATRAVKWDAQKGRWGLTLDMEQPDVRPSTLNDVQAGAYYRITPSLRVGGAVALGEQQFAPGAPGALRKFTDEGQPRVRLETRFRF